MPEIIETTVYRLNELSDAAKDKARALRYRAAALEARLVDPNWREHAADLLRLPQAA